MLALAIGVKFYMSAFTGKTARALDSSAMMATAQDYKSDCISTAVVLACLLLFRFTGLNADGLGGLVERDQIGADGQIHGTPSFAFLPPF